MTEHKKPLKRSIFIGCSIFIALLCLILSVITYTNYTRALYHACESQMTDILEYTENHIDIEDLSECTKTGIESEKYYILRDFMDSIMDEFNIHYLYICLPVIDGDNSCMVSIVSADTHYGRLYEPDDLYLCYRSTDEYELKDILLYQNAFEKDGIVFFKNFSSWGYDYTASKTLVNSKGERFAMLCVDVEVSELQRAIHSYTMVNIALIILLGALFITLFLLWMNRNITDPISKLEKSVVSFAQNSHEQKDPEMLSYDAPAIHTGNEVESLSKAVEQMSKDMRIYAKNILDAEFQVEDMKSQVSHMDILAYQDSLTHVKNKAWYDKVKARVDDDIMNGRAHFAIVMADLNHLKLINDTYGHENGDLYISGACHQICVIYDHSPVFRIGGDEFVVLLENRDYGNRNILLKQLRATFELTSNDLTKDPWDRYSVALGMAVFDSSTDISVDDVFKRADMLMYQDKLASKNERSE
ncbi:MAG: GGDEF domain-containing protein [Butyrivibrio sp.]|nr:GGDEF domain-containing protein [Butyrivibrio sp.]